MGNGLLARHTPRLAPVIALAFAVGCNKDRSVTADPASSASAESKLAAPAIVEPETDFQKIQKLGSFSQALVFAKPKMEDTYAKIDAGTALFALWSIKKLRWSDISVSKNETTVASVLKDSEAARGKRMCFSGTIIEIAVEKTEEGKVFNGLIVDPQMDLYRFNAVGSTGDLVAKSNARFCGIVTSKFDYPNSAGGTGHAIKIVGMFDLPENKQL